MTLFANNFLAGGIISLLFPVLLLLAIWTWYWYSAKRIGHDESRPDQPVAAQTDATAAAGAPALRLLAPAPPPARRLSGPEAPDSPYQAWVPPQRGQSTDVETRASNRQPHAQE